MMTYLLLNSIVIAVVVAALARHLRRPNRAMLLTILGLFLLTTIFDNIIIGLGIVDYDTHKILGLFVGLAPIEDFMYPLLGAIMVPTLWQYHGAKKKSES